MTVNGSETRTRLTEQVAEEIRALLARRRISGRELARRMEKSHSWVNFRLTGAQPITVDDLQDFAAVLNVEVTDLLPHARAVRTEPSEGRTVVVSGSRTGQTTVSYPPLTVQPRPTGHPKRTSPPLSSRRPGRLLHA